MCDIDVLQHLERQMRSEEVQIEVSSSSRGDNNALMP